MKKILATMLLAAATTGVFAQTGEKSVSFGVSYGSKIKSVGFGLKGQYNFSDAVRGEFGGDYFLKKDGLSMWDLNLNIHYLFPIADNVKVYPLGGLSFSRWTMDAADYVGSKVGGEWGAALGQLAKEAGVDTSDSSNEFGGNIGGGIQYDINDQFRVGFEAKYQIFDDFSQFVPTLSIAYKF